MNRKPDITYAGFPIRLLAVLIDALILFPIADLLMMMIDGLFFQALMNMVIAASYYMLFLSGSWQATPGKRIVGIYVIHHSGRALNQREALQRYLGYIIPTLPLYSSLKIEEMNMITMWLALVWFAPIFMTKQRTPMHDILCNTRVIVGRIARRT